MFHCPFHLSFHHSRCDTALSLFASKWLYVSCYALTACAMWSRGSWLGGSLVSAWCFCCFAHLLVWPCDFDVLPLFLLPYHVKMNNVITLALISPWTGTCHASVWLFCFGLLCFALFWWVCFWFLFSACGDFVTAYWTMRRSYTSSLLRPLNLQTAMYALIN